MLNLPDIRLKAEAMERLAAEGDDASAAAYREIAMQWRLMEIQAVFMEAIRPPTQSD